MHQLKALVWKAYKLRLRSPLSTALDVGGPIAVIIIYLCLKLMTSSTSSLNTPPASAYFEGSSKEFAQQLPKFICPKVLFSDQRSAIGGPDIRNAIIKECGVELININSDSLVNRLRTSLDERIAYINATANLDRSALTSGSCFTGPSGNIDYQAGIVLLSSTSYELHLTDTAYNPIVYQPYTQGSIYNEFTFPHGDLNSGRFHLEFCISNAILSTMGIETVSKLLIQQYPFVTAAPVYPILFMVLQLLANFCNALATVIRVTDDIESGLHHYVRVSGVSALTYWTSHLIVTSLHMVIQSLLIAILISIPIGTTLPDPIGEADIVFKWILLLSYSMSINMHALFVGSVFSRVTHSLLTTCFLAVCYSMHPVTFMLQWTPYQFSPLNYIIDIVLFNPVSTHESLLLVLYATYLQKDSPFEWSQLSSKIVGGGMNEWSVGSLWLWLVIQIVFWFLATIVLDMMRFSSIWSGSLAGILFGTHWICCMGGQKELSESQIDAILGAKLPTSRSKPDPNRVCCSLRQVAVRGPTMYQAYTRGDPLKLTTEQIDMLKRTESTQASKTHQYLVNWKQSKVPQNSTRDMPIILDEALRQHIMWRKTSVAFENLDLDFHFNQVSFVLGQPNLKELLFATLLGLRFLQSGNVALDRVVFSADNIHLARHHIGLLGERDIFLNDLSIYENLQFFGSLRDSSYTRYDSESLFVLALLHLTSRRDHFPAVLTHRSARKLALAVAAVGHTKLLLLVEPTMSLRWKPRCQVLNLLKKYKSIRSIVVDTSDVDEAVAFGDRVLLLRNNQVDLDGTPSHLSKKLNCGYWLVFEPANSDTKTISNDSVKALDNLTSEMFKQDKIDPVDVTRRSVYEELMKIASQEGGNQSKSELDTSSDRKHHNGSLQRQTVVVKFKQSASSTQALCAILKMASQQNIHGFRLTELTFESLEDVLVLRMSKAMYPDLPPDLLLSLQHRTQRDLGHDTSQPLVCVRKSSNETGQENIGLIPFGSNIRAILKDRMSQRRELILHFGSIFVSLVILASFLWLLQANIKADQSFTKKSYPPRISGNSRQESNLAMNLEVVDSLYKNRIVFFVLGNDANGTSKIYLDRWSGQKKFSKLLNPNYLNNQTLSNFAAKVIQDSRDVAAAILIFNPDNGFVTLIFDQYLPRAMMAGMRAFINLRLNSQRDGNGSKAIGESSTAELSVSEHSFSQPWHEIIKGSMTRRFFYGLGLGFAEAVSIGSFVLAPLRHRTEFRVIKLQITYLTAMAIFDMGLSLILVIGYIVLIILFDNIYSIGLMTCMFFVFMLYKLASLPIAYLVSFVAEYPVHGFLFIFLTQMTATWAFSIHLQTFVEWTMIDSGYLYTVANWIMLSLPINSLIDSIVDMTQINRIDQLCSQVPAYTSSAGAILTANPSPINMIDKNIYRLRECLNNGKTGVRTGVLHQRNFGILWDIYLTALFCLISWAFLLFSERVFGNITRRFSSIKTTADPLKSIVRTPEPSLFKWDREKDRLVSDYIRCMNEIRYAKHMANNCLYVRIWLKPMSSQTTIDKNISFLLEPMINSGQPKNDIQVELRTTFQLFIRLGSESNRYKVDKVQLIETYSTFLKENQDKLLKFAVMDWTRETLYKILLHGHYNAKSSTPST